MLHVFCPEEPELIVYLGGGFKRFVNSRLDISDDEPASIRDFFVRQSTEGHTGRFLVSDSLDDVGLALALQTRISRMVARKADAQNPSRVANDANFLTAVALSKNTGDIKPVTNQQALDATLKEIGRVMPQQVAELDPIRPYGERKASEADAQLILEAAQGGVREEPVPEQELEVGPKLEDTEIPAEFFPTPEPPEAPADLMDPKDLKDPKDQKDLEE